MFTNRQIQEPIEDEKVPEFESKQRISLAKKELVPEIEVKSENPQFISTVHQKEKQRTSLNRVKPFKDMGILERLDYLINFPKVLPPVPCVFYTAEENYHGFLTEYDQHQIVIQIHDQTSITIPVEELKSVMMIGIRR